ncbi:MAG TPA: hypothetical protein VIM11_22485 [Tepidisphaeraceae bacterium]|jgi:hypothetical protein
MAQIRRTVDHSIWFNATNFQQQPNEGILEYFSTLAAGQQVVVELNGHPAGTWARYNGGAFALKSIDNAAEQAWDAIPVTNPLTWVQIALGNVGVPNPAGPNLAAGPVVLPVAQAVGGAATPNFEHTNDYVASPDGVLCIGLDLAWWGGSRNDPDSRNDALSYLFLRDGNATEIEATRISLGNTFNGGANGFTPNCDPNADLVLGAIEAILIKHQPTHVVLAVDAPLAAAARQLPPRLKVPGPGTLARREPENILAAAIATGPADWRQGCNIQPGAPLCPRVANLVNGLVARCGFGLYGHGGPVPKRCLIECFPSAAIWAIGCQGHYGVLSSRDAREYKTFDNCFYPWHSLVRAVNQHLFGFIPAIGVPGPVVRSWIAALSGKLLWDALLVEPTGCLMRGGKLFDDVLDSVNCLLTAVSFASNSAHVWVGNIPADGHIIGPGR